MSTWLNDILTDEVEKVSRVPSTSASSVNEPDDDGDAQDSEGSEGGDVTMEDIPKKPATKKRKPKASIPVGRNGLKKRKITKTRRMVDANGYTRRFCSKNMTWNILICFLDYRQGGLLGLGICRCRR